MRMLIRKRRRPGLLLGAACLTGGSLAYTVPNRGPTNVFQTQLSQGGSSVQTAPTAKKEVHLPPWISRHEATDQSVVEKQVELLEFNMLEQGFSPIDIRDVAITMEQSSKGDTIVLAGIVEFLQLMLQMEDKSLKPHVFVTKEVLMASAIHYAECTTARQEGVYDIVREAIYQDQSHNWLLPADLSEPRLVDDPILEYFEKGSRKTTGAIILVESDGLAERSRDGSYGDEVSRIALGAAKVKRAEIMAQTVLTGRSWTKEESSKLRGLLLSVMDDWKSLGIRAVACLYRLDGILDNVDRGVMPYIRTPEMVRAAREAIRVYAPLAQRLGMQRLKAKIEDSAFRVLYKRQYRAASALYQHNGPAMKAMSRYLEGQITHILLENDQLMSQLEDIRITSRVKEPYSSWKKMVKKRFIKPSQSGLEGSPQRAIALSSPSSSELSMVDVKDGVALRVILRARKHDSDEPDETRARERLLCYYVHHLLRTQWDLLDTGEMKDYIQFPKENGYQSLHYNSFISSQGQEWPFEVQVRSEEMHRIAEYGVAAHWDYKLGNQNAAALPSLELCEPVRVQGDVVNEVEVSLPVLMPPGEDSYIGALVTAKDELVQNKVFVFFASSAAIANEGQILSLPVGAQVGDALEELETMIGSKLEIREGSHNLKIMKNGREASGDDLIGNGDVLLINHQSPC